MLRRGQAPRECRRSRPLSDPLLVRFTAQTQRLLPPPGHPVILAVSGGADSMALWALCARLGHWPLIIWHLDHGLRPDSAEDAAWLHRVALPGERIIEQAQFTGTGIEAAARRERYARLTVLAAQRGIHTVATAHHRDDQAETVLFNLLRGAGPIGLSGIAPRRMLGAQAELVRPLLAFSRSELRAWLVDAGHAWREDASNRDLRFARNRLRHRLLPQLEALLPDCARHLARWAARTRKRARADREQAAARWSQRVDSHGAGSLDLAPVLQSTVAIRHFVWRSLLRDLGAPLTRALIAKLDDLATGAAQRKLHVGRWLFLRTRSDLCWDVAMPIASAAVLTISVGDWQRGDQTLTVRELPAPADPRCPAHEAWIDLAAVQAPVIWRCMVPGERWQPLGSPGHRPMVKSLAEAGIPVRQRGMIAVLADTHGVLWIPGIGLAERARIHATSVRAWRVVVRASV